jgi:hypothetical protein
MKKIEPAVQTFLVNTPAVAAGVTSTSYIDLSQVASLLNRRFYRQGINWAVSGMKIFSGTSGQVTISKLPETWVMSNAWEKSFRVWQRMNNDALEETESVRPRFLDFKIYADAQHHTLGYDANLLPTNVLGGSPITPGEWESSKVVVPQTTNDPAQAVSFELLAVGANNPGVSPVSGLDAKSLIEGYAASRALPNIEDPNVPADAVNDAENWMVTMFNEGTKQTDYVLDDMTTENNIAPYPFENDGANFDTMYPNGANQFSGMQLHDFETISNTTIGGITRVKGGMFPCGLIRIDHVPGETTANLAIQIDLVPGSHRGYLCEPMTEM